LCSHLAPSFEKDQNPGTSHASAEEHFKRDNHSFDTFSNLGSMNMGKQFALVTGASSGIGAAFSLELLKAGWHVALLARRVDPIHAMIKAHGVPPQQTLVLSADVSDEAQVSQAYSQIEKQFTRLDLLFNNAGVFPSGQLPSEISTEDWTRAVNVNINGSFYCLSHAFKMMQHQSPMGGRIINNGSISAHAPRPGSIAYTTTKHAMTGLTKAAALDGRAFNIAVGQIDIGNVASDMTLAMAQGIKQADGSIKQEARMDMSNVTQTLMNMASLPLSANVLFTTIMASNMPFVGRG
jgi:NAD(P)-dependent dehydrogenase (short-subunit alcohol dehydrogenase family)